MVEVKLVGSEIVQKEYTGMKCGEVGHFNWVNYATFCDSETAQRVLSSIDGKLVTDVKY